MAGAVKGCSDMRVAVVGAGFAGLQAASDLRAAGHDVVVLEARDRVGGRVWSAELIPGDPGSLVERGAEFVLSGYELMATVLADLRLSLVDAGMNYYVREPRGGVPTTHEAMSAVAGTVAAAASGAPWDRSLAEVLDALPRDGSDAQEAAITAYRTRITVTHGYPAEQIAAVSAADGTASFEPRPTRRVAGGNQRLADGLADRLGTAVRLGTPVRSLRWDEQGVRLGTDNGEVVADQAVLTIPLARLPELVVEPALPQPIVEAWARAGIGHNAKLHVPLTVAVAPGAVIDVPNRYWTWTALDSAGRPQPVVHGFTGTEQALADLEVADGPSTWVAALAASRPELALRPELAQVSTWNDDPWAGLSYLAAATSMHPDDQVLLARSVGPIHFAGEHTAGEWSGLMEGALRSGRRAAATVNGRVDPPIDP